MMLLALCWPGFQGPGYGTPNSQYNMLETSKVELASSHGRPRQAITEFRSRIWNTDPRDSVHARWIIQEWSIVYYNQGRRGIRRNMTLYRKNQNPFIDFLFRPWSSPRMYFESLQILRRAFRFRFESPPDTRDSRRPTQASEDPTPLNTDIWQTRI